MIAGFGLIALRPAQRIVTFAIPLRGEPSLNLCATAGPTRKLASSEWVLVGFAMLALLAAEAMLCAAILGTNYYGVDGKMAQATILAAFKFGAHFSINNLSPIEGVGSQLLPMNAWANPAYWPFALVGKELATDISAMVALGIFAVACYLMARCFDVPVLPSIIAAQSTVVLFAPAVLILRMPTVFCLTPGNAVVYAPHMIALGLLGRLEPGSWRDAALTTAAIAALLFYSLYCDPLWTAVDGVSWALPFAVVTFGPLRRRTILLRCAVVTCCLALLLVTGVGEYLYTLSQYTARVQFPLVVDRSRGPAMVSALSYSPNMKTFYLAVVLGWLLGFFALRGRSRVLVAAGFITFLAWVAYSVVYLLVLNKPWIPPIPMYVEQCLFPLYLASAIAGYWGALRGVADWGYRLSRIVTGVAAGDSLSPSVRHLPFSTIQCLRIAAIRRGVPRFAHLMSPPVLLGAVPRQSTLGAACIRFAPSFRLLALSVQYLLVAIIPATMANYAHNGAEPFRQIYYERWPNEPEVSKFLNDNVHQAIGEPFRGSIMFWSPDYPTIQTMTSLWARGIHTVNEYSQLVTPQALYFIHMLFKQNVKGHLNFFQPYFGDRTFFSTYWGAVRMFGVRYFFGHTRLPEADDLGLTPITLPHTVVEKEPAIWQIYEVSRPNVGDLSPTEVVTAGTAAEIMRALMAPNFDFGHQAVLETEIGQPLVPARDMRLVRIRGSVHVSGNSNGTSLVILPLQFTHCLRARDQRVRLVRANLMMTGMIFSGVLDTDILFDYGIFSPRCRHADLADTKRLGLDIDLRMPHLTGDRIFPDWGGVLARLRAAAKAIQ